MRLQDAQELQSDPLLTPTHLPLNATQSISTALTLLLADMFALYIKTKNFHWHISGPHFRGDHLMLEEQGAQILATTDAIAERVRKVGGTTIRSIGHISRLQRVPDSGDDDMAPIDMLTELRVDNLRLAASIRETHQLCDDYGDVASVSLLEPWIDEAEGRIWFLFERTRRSSESESVVPTLPTSRRS
jgi:starvation-inducible DNA-binding protein